MTAMFDTAAPRIFAISPGVDASDAVVEGLLARTPPDAPPDWLARVEVFVNARRSGQSILDALMRRRPVLLPPRIRYLHDPESALGLEAADLPAAVDPTRRLIALTRLTDTLLARTGRFGPRANAPALAETLARLLDEMQETGLPFSALEGLVADEHAANWRISLDFLQIVRQAWPAHLQAAENGAVDPAEARQQAATLLIERWRTAPPPHPVIAVGSTGSRPITARLLAAIAALPQGAVILPGLDAETDPAIWKALEADGAGAEHPLSQLCKTAENLGVALRDIRPWIAPPPALAPRRNLLQQALRPAPVTDEWMRASAGLGREAGQAAQGLTLLEAPDPRREAAALALAMREALETPDKTAALITPDRALARRVVAELARWGLEADESSGAPLTQTPPGVFARLVLETTTAPGPLSLLSLLKHPLTRAGDRGPHLEMTRMLEIVALRKVLAPADPESLRRSISAWEAERPDGRRERAEQLGNWLDQLERDLAPLQAVDALAPISDHAASLRAALTNLSGEEIWDRAAGDALAALFDRLQDHGSADLGGLVDKGGFRALFLNLIQREDVRIPGQRPHPRLFIWGQLEARMQAADLMLLGGLNEGVWPAAPAPDPWLNRPMRAELGLAPPERRTGLSAHDFMNAAAAPEVILSRSLKEGGAPAVPSRWLVRLENLMSAAAPETRQALAEARAEGDRLLSLSECLQRPDQPVKPAPRPEPQPPLAARPRELSVTRIETLIRDPYAIYAGRILNLRPLKPIGGDPDPAYKGEMFHDIVEAFVDATRQGLGPDRRARLMAAAEARLDDLVAAPATRLVWRRQFERITDWLLEGEAKRRESGAPLALEATGRLKFDTPGGAFTLTAKADRIDMTRDGIAIYDYKTGKPPTAKQVDTFAKQLPLEAAIAAGGGFDGLPSGPVTDLIYLRLSASKPEEKKIADPATAAADALEGLKQLIASFDDENTLYSARSRPKLLTYGSDYDHLSRFGEWGVDEDGE